MFYKNGFPTSAGDVRLLKISLAPMEIKVFTNQPIEENNPNL
jgi:hypothetical protein